MSNLAIGNSFCAAAPHYKSTMMGVSEYLGGGTLASAALQAALSLTYNLPHLCGLGGDAIIMHKHGDKIDTYNGTGKTWSHQHLASYQNKGINTIPRRGVYSTMIYGCPAAYDQFVNQNRIDLNRIMEKFGSGRFITSPSIHTENRQELSNCEDRTKQPLSFCALAGVPRRSRLPI